MSYSCENTIPKSVSRKNIVKLIDLLGYTPVATFETKEGEILADYSWFDSEAYRSWTGITLGLVDEGNCFKVSTTTSMGRSYYDLQHQNETARTFRRMFGGSLTTDEGKNRFLHPRTGPPSPQQSGCKMAFERFGFNLQKAAYYFEQRQSSMPEPVGFMTNEMNPCVLSNSLLLPFLVATIEEFFRTMFIALLTHSRQKEAFFKNARLGPSLVSVSNGECSVEEALAQTLSFQSISSLCRHFREFDSRIDFAGALRKPFRRRKITLFSSWENLVLRRHDVVHRSKIDLSLTDYVMHSILQDIEVGTCRCYRHLMSTYKWPYEKRWNLDRRPKPKPPSFSIMATSLPMSLSSRKKVPHVKFKT